MNHLWIYLCIIAMIVSGIHPSFYKILNQNLLKNKNQNFTYFNCKWN